MFEGDELFRSSVSPQRLRVLGAVITLAAVATASAGIYHAAQSGSSPSPAGYTAAGSVDGDVLWVKYATSADGQTVAFKTTGRDAGSCDASGPLRVGYLVCSGWVSGKAAVIAMLVPPQVARVEIGSSSGPITLTVLPPTPGNTDAFALAVIPNSGGSPQFGPASYFDRTNQPVRLTS